jgi:hypothetical protein
MCDVLLPPGFNPTAVKYIYHIKPQTHTSKPPPRFRRKQGSINNIRNDLTILIEIKLDNRKVKNIQRATLHNKYNKDKEENLDQLIEELNRQKATLGFRTKATWGQI